MVKANELRLGNYLRDKVSWEIMVVDELGENIGAVIVDRSKYPLPDGWQMEGIPLTKDWLTRLGFDNGVRRIDEHGMLRILEDGRYEIVEFTDAETYRSYDNRIEYVHQLQNLFFALADEFELTLKAHV